MDDATRSLRLLHGRYSGGVKRAKDWLLGLWGSYPSQISVLLLVAIAAVAVSPALSAAVRWTPDSLFYEAQVYELRGESQTAALHGVFSTPAAAALSRTALRGRRSQAWISYSARFYRRRWVTPAIAAALFPLAGTRSLLYAAMLGYIAVGPLIFALSRQRTTPAVALMIAAICLLLPPVRASGMFPLTDSWGLALETGALLAAILAIERGGKWIALWVVSMLALSFARDATLILVLGTAWWWWRTRTPRAAVIAITGFAASIPAPVLFRAPVVQQLSWELEGSHIPHPASWSVIAGQLPAALATVLRDDVRYPAGLALPYVAYAGVVALVAAVVYMIRAAPRNDPLYVISRVALVGCVLTVALSASYTDMRVELVFVPIIAVALAVAIDRLSGRSVPTFPAAGHSLVPGVVGPIPGRSDEPSDGPARCPRPSSS